MKALMTALAASLLLLNPAFAETEPAQDLNTETATEETFIEQEEGAMSAEDLEAIVDHDSYEMTDEGIMIPGALLGVERPEVLDARSHRDGRRGPGMGRGGDHRRHDHWRPDRPGHHRPPHWRPHRPGRPIVIINPRPDYRRVTCFAQNRRGQVFRATGNNSGIVQRRAMQKCQSQSGACRPMGCRR